MSLFGRHHHQETNILGEVQLEEFLFVSEKIFMIKLRKKGEHRNSVDGTSEKGKVMSDEGYEENK